MSFQNKFHKIIKKHLKTDLQNVHIFQKLLHSLQYSFKHITKVSNTFKSEKTFSKQVKSSLKAEK